MTASILSDSLVSPLGIGSETNFNAIREGLSAIKRIEDVTLSPVPFYGAQLSHPEGDDTLTRFERLSVLSIKNALQKNSAQFDFSKTIFILATTKGNIELLERRDKSNPALLLHTAADRIAKHVGVDKSTVVSNACTSGVMAVILAKKILAERNFNHAIVTGTDVLSRFVVSGFQSLHALSDEPCKPFDADRRGLNLGEASATVILSSVHKSPYTVSGSATTNDANHISGPSRTGEELSMAVKKALANAQLTNTDIDFISAHGTATLYNDEMEAKAFNHAGMGHIPVNSLKGYFGHTLGAAGLVEIVMSLQSLKQNELLATKGFNKPGVSLSLNVIARPEQRPLKTFLKTASGFGGCNATIIIKKEL
ncbi:MAG: beta-ketoacyl-[acyl-carrier-protein] synthase family protein [Cyclobacteriaceae bacterium]|nr:beta-ketoacyl-[acyl-carrier-protein] synthase family protein [Cyclobacteriaceae bacterium]